MSIRTKLIVPMVLLSVLLGLAGSLLVIDHFDSLESSFVSLFVESRVQDMEKSVHEKSKGALQVASVFSRMPEVVAAYEVAAQGDMADEADPFSQAAREQLRQDLAPVLQGYEAALGAKLRVHFHLPTAHSLLRAWRDMQAKRDGQWVDLSDDLSDFRQTVIQVNQTHEPVMGIEPGRGGFTIRGLAPVTAPDGRHLGSVEVLVGFQSLLDAMEAGGTVKSLLFMDADLLGITTSLRDQEKYPLLEDRYVLLHGLDFGQLLDLVDTGLLDSAMQGSRVLVRGALALGAFPVLDYQGKAIGVVVLSQNIGVQKSMIREMTVFFGVCLLLVLLLPLAVVLWVFQRGVMRPVARAVRITGEMSKGDLSRRLDIVSKDEVGVLASAINTLADSLEAKAELAQSIADNDLTAEVRVDSDQDVLGLALRDMSRNLNDLLGKVRLAAEDVHSASDQVSSASQALSQGATEQAASLEQISASLTEVSGQTKKNAENAGTARDSARKASERVQQSQAEMTAMVAAMSEVTESSEAIAKIIKVIDEIAFQTNLLALNAAVEAARAGHHGKGFSVVAQEVRNLAGRSAKAAQETAALIEGSVSNVRHTNQTVGQAVDSLEAVAKDVGRMTGLVEDIAQASMQQSDALREVSEGLQQIDQVTQSNTASAEETSAASEELASQASQLSGLVRRFRLRGQDRPQLASGPSAADLESDLDFGMEAGQGRGDSHGKREQDAAPGVAAIAGNETGKNAGEGSGPAEPEIDLEEPEIDLDGPDVESQEAPGDDDFDRF